MPSLSFIPTSLESRRFHLCKVVYAQLCCLHIHPKWVSCSLNPAPKGSQKCQDVPHQSKRLRKHCNSYLMLENTATFMSSGLVSDPDNPKTIVCFTQGKCISFQSKEAIGTTCTKTVSRYKTHQKNPLIALPLTKYYQGCIAI